MRDRRRKRILGTIFFTARDEILRTLTSIDGGGFTCFPVPTNTGIAVRDIRGYEAKLRLGYHEFEVLTQLPRLNMGNSGEDVIKTYLEDLANMVKRHLSAESALAYKFRVRCDARLRLRLF